MEQVINPSANSEKYIKETDLKINDFKTKLDSLENQYSNVIKNKDNEVLGEKKKVNDISSSLNTIINSKDSRIRELESENNRLKSNQDNSNGKFDKLKEYLYWYKRVNITTKSVQARAFPQDINTRSTVNSSYSVKVSDTFTLDTNACYVVYGFIIKLDSESHNCNLEVQYSDNNRGIVNVHSSNMFVYKYSQDKERSTGGYFRFSIPRMNSRQVNCHLAVEVTDGDKSSIIKTDGYLIFQKIPDAVYIGMDYSAYTSDLKRDIKERLEI